MDPLLAPNNLLNISLTQHIIVSLYDDDNSEVAVDLKSSVHKYFVKDTISRFLRSLIHIDKTFSDSRDELSLFKRNESHKNFKIQSIVTKFASRLPNASTAIFNGVNALNISNSVGILSLFNNV